MLSPRTRYFYLLVATILMAASLPLQSFCEVTSHPDATSCATGAAAEGHVPCTDSPDDSSDCCSGCIDCGLPCCVGTAVILTATPTLAAVAPIKASLLTESLVSPQVDPAPLGRPPRA